MANGNRVATEAIGAASKALAVLARRWPDGRLAPTHLREARLALLLADQAASRGDWFGAEQELHAARLELGVVLASDDPVSILVEAAWQVVDDQLARDAGIVAPLAAVRA